MNQREFGEKISALRKAKGMTQAQLAEMLHVSNKAVSRWETGEGYPEITLLSPLAKALGVSVDELLGDMDDTAADAPFRTQDGKREYKHKNIPVSWPKLSFTMKDKIKHAKLRKSLCLLDMAALIYFIAVISVLYFAGMSSIYLDGKTSHWGQFCTSQTGYCFLGIAAIIDLALIGLHAYFMVRDSRRFVYLRNMIFLGAALLSVWISLTPVRGIKQENLNMLSDYGPGTWLSCDSFQINRQLIRHIAVVLILCYLVSTVIHALIRFVAKRRSTADPEAESAPGTIKLKRKKGDFWRSLTVFNKISWVCIMVSAGCVTIYLILSILIMISQYPVEELYYFVTSSAIISIAITISGAASRIGLIAGLIGIGAGLLDVYDRQLKDSIIIVIINLALIYVPALVIIASQGIALGFGTKY